MKCNPHSRCIHMFNDSLVNWRIPLIANKNYIYHLFIFLDFLEDIVPLYGISQVMNK